MATSVNLSDTKFYNSGSFGENNPLTFLRLNEIAKNIIDIDNYNKFVFNKILSYLQSDKLLSYKTGN